MAVHDALICVAAPALTVSGRHGQLRGEGCEGLYRDGRRLLARCVLTVAGIEPVAVQAGILGADRARFMAVVRTTADRGPDPSVSVERVRSADGSERITMTNAGPLRLRLPVEIALGTDLAVMGAPDAGRAGPRVTCAVSGAGLRWSDGEHAVQTTAGPAPDVVLAATGVLGWRLDLPAGASRTIELRTSRVAAVGSVPGPSRTARPPRLWPDAALDADDPRAGALLGSALEDLHGLLLRDPHFPADLHTAAGAPWRLGLAPADALWAARILLPFGTRLAGGTLRTLARMQDPGTGRIPGAPRDMGPHLPPLSSATEATLLFVTLLAEAWRWGLPARETEPLLPAAERCLDWLRGTVAASDAGGLVADPAPGGPLRTEVQAHAHRAALHGADLLDAFDSPGAGEWRDRAAELRAAFHEQLWIDDPGGGRPAAARTADGRAVDAVSSSLAHLLDTGLSGGGRTAPGLLDGARTAQLGRLLVAPGLDSGWGLRTLSAGAPGFNPFGHRSGAVRIHESVLAVTGLAASGLQEPAAALMEGLLDAAAAFGLRMPEMHAGGQRTVGASPCPHPMACRPAALAAAGSVHLLSALAGVRPDVPGGSVTLRPLPCAAVGAVRLSGIRVAEAPFAVQVGRLGTATVEGAAAGLRVRA